MRKLAVVFGFGLGVLLFAIAGGRSAYAGPIIIDGTDANDHGGEAGGVNQLGWKYMESALEALRSQVHPTGTAKVVVDLGSSSVDVCEDRTPPTPIWYDARQAITSAFGLSELAVTYSWTITHVDGAAAIDTWLTNISTTNTGILYIPSHARFCGDLDDEEMAVINAHAADIAAYVGPPGDPSKGGALFALGQEVDTDHPDGFGWLTSLIPGIVITSAGPGGIDTELFLTITGTQTFPGLTNADLSAGPWHNHFQGNLGSLQVLAVATETVGITRNVILGGGISTTLGTGGSNLFVNKTVTPTVGQVGSPLIYTIVVTNGGPDPATNVVLTDEMPATLVVGPAQTTQGVCTGTTTVVCNLGTINVTSGATVTIVATPTTTGPIVNHVTIKGDQNDPDPVCPTCTVTTTVGTPAFAFDLTGSAAITQCVYPGSDFQVTWTLTNVGDLDFPGGVLNTAVTGGGSGPSSVAVGVVPSGTTSTVNYTVMVSQPVNYGDETITVTGNILTATSMLTAHICAPDFRTSFITVTSQMVVAHEEFTYTFFIRNTGDADAINARALITLSDNPLLTFQGAVTASSGVTTLVGPITQPTHLEWQGDVPIGGEVVIVWHVRSRFGLPAFDIVRPFEITHPWRPPFYGTAQYLYPHKLYFVVILKDMASPRR